MSTMSEASSSRQPPSRLTRIECYQLLIDAQDSVIQAHDSKDIPREDKPKAIRSILKALWGKLGDQIQLGWKVTQDLEVRLEQLQARVQELESQLEEAEYVSIPNQITGDLH